MVVLVACGSSTQADGDAGNDAGSGDVVVSDVVTANDVVTTNDSATPSGAWSLGYYASWEADAYPPSEIEWSGLTHVAASFYLPQNDGTLTLLGANPSVMNDLVVAAHAHGVKAIASVGGADSGPMFQKATASANLTKFVGNVVTILESGGYDGIDIDWEPITAPDEAIVIDLANKIRAAHAGAIMTLAIGYINPNAPPDTSQYSGIAAVYDQMNIMSYGMAGAWSGWNSWHNSPLYQTDSHTPLSIDQTVKAYEAVGVPKAKLGIGIGFYGLCYSSPVTAPDQALGGSTIVANDGTMSYANIMSKYFSSSARQWDPLARVPYLSFSSPHAPDGCTYISYDDQQSITEKGAYVKSSGVGGVMQWEINEAYIASAPIGQRNPLLTAIHDHVLH